MDWAFVETNPLRVADPGVFVAQKAAVEAARADGDSVGGVCEVWIEGLPVGLGDPAFGKLDGLLALACMSIGAVKGVELGAGFASARRRGSENNDPLGPGAPQERRRRHPRRHQHRGARGGAAGREAHQFHRQDPEDHRSGGPAFGHRHHGRHDPCIAPRIVPVAEAMCALVIYDAWLSQQALREGVRPGSANGTGGRRGPVLTCGRASVVMAYTFGKA